MDDIKVPQWQSLKEPEGCPRAVKSLVYVRYKDKGIVGQEMVFLKTREECKF